MGVEPGVELDMALGENAHLEARLGTVLEAEVESVVVVVE